MSIIEFCNKNNIGNIKQQKALKIINNKSSSFDKLLKKSNDDEITAYLLQLLSQYEFDTLLDFLKQKQENIDNETKYVEWDFAYISALIDTWDLEKANKILKNKEQYYIENQLSLVYLEQCKERLDIALQSLYEDEQKFKNEIKDRIVQVDLLPYVLQQEIVTQVSIFDNDELKIYAEQLLLSEKFHPLLKSYLLDILVSQQMSGVIQMNWFNNIKTIELDRLTLILESKMIRQLYQKLEHLSETDILKQNITLYMSLAYPFEEQIFSTIDCWIDEVKKKHAGDDSNEWLNRFEILLNEINM